MSELIDNRAQRVRTLKGIIKRLHAGEAPDEVRASLPGNGSRTGGVDPSGSLRQRRALHRRVRGRCNPDGVAPLDGRYVARKVAGRTCP